MNQYTVSTEIVLSVTFKTDQGVLISPAIVKASVRAPDEEVTQYAGADIDNPSPGVFEVRYRPEINGLYQYRFAGYNAEEEALVSAEDSFLAESEFIGEGAP